MASVIVVFSGCGGIGKSVFSSNLSYGLCSHGKKVLLVEACFGNRADDIILGVKSDSIYSFSDVCTQNCKPHEAIIKSQDSCIPDLVSAGLFAKDADLSQGISNIVNSRKSSYDYIILDTASCFDSAFEAAIKHADIALALTNDSPISVRNTALALTNVRNMSSKKAYVVLNNIVINGNASTTFAEDISDELGEMIIGIVPTDEHIKSSVENSDPIYKYNTYAGRSIENICKRIMGLSVPEYETGVSGSIFSKNKLVLK